MDAGIRGASPVPVDISRQKIAKYGGRSLAQVQNIGHEGQALEVMTRGAIACAQDLNTDTDGGIFRFWQPGRPIIGPWRTATVC